MSLAASVATLSCLARTVVGNKVPDCEAGSRALDRWNMDEENGFVGIDVAKAARENSTGYGAT
jgi:hypothetical protein